MATASQPDFPVSGAWADVVATVTGAASVDAVYQNVGTYSDGSNGHQFYLAAALFIDRALTTGERDTVESAFADLLGITI